MADQSEVAEMNDYSLYMHCLDVLGQESRNTIPESREDKISWLDKRRYFEFNEDLYLSCLRLHMSLAVRYFPFPFLSPTFSFEKNEMSTRMSSNSWFIRWQSF